MDPDPRHWIAALRTSHERLAKLVVDLDDDGLATQSMCTDWTVARVLSHLGSGAEIGLENLEANVAGREPPG
jgi:Mycothiol maleylpyruvate isomerase N-terminal domain